MSTTKVSLIVQPGDSFFPIVNAIDKAKTSINITVFRMDDPIIQEALAEAHRRGVRVRVLVATSARGWEDKNRRLLKDAKKVGIEIKEPAGDSKGTRFHYKVMTVDGKQALVFTFNPTRENLHYTRDFGVHLFDEQIAAELNRLFNADWDDTAFAPDERSPLLVSPYNSREKLTDFFTSAKSSIHIWDAKLSDPAIIRLLDQKAKDGVDVRVICEEHPPVPAGSAIGSREITRFKLHAKCFVVDGERAVLGSMNLRTTSFDKRREVCVAIDDSSIAKRLEAVFTADWEHKPPVSGSDKTILIGAVPAPPADDERPVEDEYVLISRTDALRRFGVKQGVTSIGRADESDVVVSSGLVSRNHARVTLEGDSCTITDLGSSNGTFVNGGRVKGTVPLASGDVVGVADFEEFRFVRL
jgi:cardiolipin synthase A/B